MQNFRVKLVTARDGGVGKSCLLISYFTNTFPGDYVPTVFDSFCAHMVVNGKPYAMQLWDTAGQEDYDRLRPLSYPGTDVFLLCFSVESRDSLTNIEEKWRPELSHFAPNVPVVLIATKIDLRTGPHGQQCIKFDEGYAVAKKHNWHYAETSALTQTGLKELFETAVETASNPQFNPKKKKGFGLFGKKDKPVPVPPVMPPAGKAPWLEIETSIYGDNMATALQNSQATDVVFVLEGVKEVKCHKVILCSACNYFCQVFGISAPVEQDEAKIPFKFTWSGINEGKVAGLSSIADVEEEDGCHITKITISDDISFEVFSLVLEFLYIGLPKLEEGVDGLILKELRRVSKIFYLPQLVQIADNLENEEEFLNPSIGTYLNDRMGQRAKTMFMGKEKFSDIKFNVQGSVIPAHKVFLMSRCEVMAGMFGGLFTESSKGEVTLHEEDKDCFQALLEYLYTDHAPIEEGDSVGILTMADRYAQERLKNLCELYITKEVDVAVRDRIAKADIDVIGLLLGAQFHNAKQLSNWCLHFISSNYIAFTERAEFKQLDGDNIDYVEKNRWPPVSYLNEMKEYEEKIGKKSENCKVM